MKKSLCATIDMPISYYMMDEEEMTYTNGGINIGMSTAYLDKNICNEQAKGLIRTYGWKDVSALQLAKEIYGHAIVYYKFSLLEKIPGLNTEVYQHAADGVDVKNQVDEHQWLWDIIWKF